MIDQTININPNGQPKVYLVLEQGVRDTIIQYIQSAPSPAGVPVSMSNSLCEVLTNLQVVNILHQKPISNNKEVDEVSTETTIRKEDSTKTWQAMSNTKT